MSARDTIFQAYSNFAPEWVKHIRWKDWGERIVHKQKLYFKIIYFPFFCLYYTDNHRWLYQIYLRRPEKYEEVELIKQNYLSNVFPFRRDWEINEYDYDNPPRYDLTRRRLKYPEYYQGRYDTKKIPNAWGEIREVRNKYLPAKETGEIRE